MSAHLTMLMAALVAGQPSGTAPAASEATHATKSVLIRGKVVGPDGLPATDVFLTARSVPTNQVTAARGSASASDRATADDGEETRTYGWHGAPTISVYATPEGTFEIPVPARGRYTLLVEPARFLSQQLEVVAPSEELAVELKAGFFVSGRVRDTAGDFVANVDLILESSDTTAAGAGRFQVRQRFARTDDVGYFRFEGVARGRYRVCARALAPDERASSPIRPCADVAVERDVPSMLLGPVAPRPSRTRNFGDYNLQGGPAQDPALRQAQPVPLER